MKIQKSRSIRIQITLVATFAIIFSVFFCYFLGWHFEIKSFLIAISLLLGLLSMLWLFCFLLIKFEKKYYFIENEQITLWQKDKLICKVKKADIIEMCYIKFSRAFLMQWGSGYLNVTCPIEAIENRKFVSIIYPNNTAIFEIAMTLKQAKEVSNVLGRNITIK